MNDRNNAAAADNAVAEDLDDEAFLWGDDPVESGSDGTSEPSAEEIAAGTETPEELGEEGTEPAEGEETAAPVQPAQQAPVQPAAVAPAAAPAPAPSQAPASEQQQQRAPLFHEMVNANFDAAVNHVAGQKLFALSPEDAEVVEPAFAEAMERQSAKVFLRAMAGFSEMLHTALPGVVHSLIGINQEGKSVANQFYETYGFQPETHGPQLTQIVSFLRQTEPHLNRNDLMEKAATMGHAMFGTTRPAPKASGAAPAKAPNGTPAKPGTRVVARQAFTPGQKSAGGGAPVARTPGAPAKKPAPMADLNAMLMSNFDD